MSEPKIVIPALREKPLPRYLITDPMMVTTIRGSYANDCFIEKQGFAEVERLSDSKFFRWNNQLTSYAENTCRTTYPAEQTTETIYIDKDGQKVFTSKNSNRYQASLWYLGNGDYQESKCLCIINYDRGNSTTSLMGKMNHQFEVGIIYSDTGNVEPAWLNACTSKVLVVTQPQFMYHHNLQNYDAVFSLGNTKAIDIYIPSDDRFFPVAEVLTSWQYKHNSLKADRQMKERYVAALSAWYSVTKYSNEEDYLKAAASYAIEAAEAINPLNCTTFYHQTYNTKVSVP